MVKRILTLVSNETYKMFAKKYGIPNTKNIKTLRRQIYEFEKSNNINNGLYF